jgi:poly(3-hydroxybutyrate) depolymerase
MQSLYSIDSHRIWAAGFSNGAMMSETLACTSSDIFSAVGVVSGCTEMEPGNAGGLDKCDAVFGASGRLINVLHVHGNFDFIVPWNGDSVLGFPDTPTDMQRWANRVKCAGAPVQTFSNGTFSNQVHSLFSMYVYVRTIHHLTCRTFRSGNSALPACTSSWSRTMAAVIVGSATATLTRAFTFSITCLRRRVRECKCEFQQCPFFSVCFALYIVI